MLLAVFRGRFSKTAGSHPRHREARRGVDDDAPGAVFRGVLADDVAESAAERAEAGKPDLEADVGDASLRFAQQEHRPLNAPALQVAVRRLAEGRAESADVVGL